MPTPVVCPNPACARRSTVADDAAGRTVRCPACNTRFTAGGTAPPTAPTEAATVGRFVIREKLGAGAFGTVYRAYDPQLDREVAVKVPNPGVLDSPTRVERFLREARAAAGLRHPHIVPVYDAGRDGDRYYIATAFVSGKPLAAAIDPDGVDVDRAARLTRELAEALAYAHGEGVVHRDVKPANVMLDAADRVYLLDFGLAARADEASRLTTDGAVIGTPAYMAPEQAAGEAGDPQPAADQYACGVVLYELLAGRVPFEGPVPVVLHNQIHADPEPPSARRRAVSKDLETICLKALAKRPEHRYRDCQALADDLRRWQEGEPIAARRQTALERTVRYARKKPTAAVAVVLAAVTVGLGAFGASSWLLWQRAASARDRLSGEQAEAVAARSAAEKARDQLSGEQARTKDALAVAQAAEKKLSAALAGATTAQAQAETAGKAAEDARGKLAAANQQLEAEGYGRAVEMAHQSVKDGGVGLARHLLAGCPEGLRGWEWRYVHRLATPDRLALPGLAAAVVFNDWAALSPDGSLLLGPTADGTVTGWDTATAARRFTLPRHTPFAQHGEFSPDGSRVVSYGASSAPTVWDAKTGAKVCELAVPEWQRTNPNVSRWDSRSVRFAGAGRVAVHHAPTVGLYDVSTGRAVGVIGGPERGKKVQDFAVAPAGDVVVTNSQTGEVGVWDARTAAEKHVLKGVSLPAQWQRDGLVSADGRWALLAARPKEPGGAASVVVWDLKSGTELNRIAVVDQAGGSVIYRLSPTGAAVVRVGKGLAVWDARTGRKKFQHPAGVQLYTAAFSPDGRTVAAAGEDNVVRVYDAETGRLAAEYAGHTGRVGSLAFRAGSTEVVSSAADGSVRVWAPSPPAPVKTVAAAEAALQAVFSRDGSRVAIAGETGLRVRDAASGAVVRAFGWWSKRPPTAYYSAALSPDGRRVFGTLWEGGKAWDVDGGAAVEPFALPRAYYRFTAVSPDGTRLAQAVDSLLPPAIYDARTGSKVVSCGGASGSPSAAVFSPRGDRLAAGYHLGRVGVFDAATGAELVTREDGAGWLTALAYSPDGRWLAGGNHAGGGFVWDAATGKRAATLVGHTQQIHAVAFSPDGARVVTAAADRTVRLWDSTSGVCVLTLRGPTAAVLAVRFTGDGKKIVAVDQTETITTWDPAPVNQYTDPAVLDRPAPPADPAPEGDRP